MPLIPDIKLPVKKQSTPTQPVQRPAAKPAVTIRPPKQRHSWQWPSWLRNHKRLWKITGAVVAILLLIGSYCGWQVNQLYQSALAAKSDFTIVKAAVAAKDYAGAKVALGTGTAHVADAHAASRRLWPMKWLPWIHTQFVVVDQLLIAGEHVGAAGQPLLDIAQQVNDVVGSESVTANQIGQAEKEALLKTLYESPDTVTQAQGDLQAAVDALKELPTSGVVAPLQVVVQTVRDNLPTIEAAVSKGLPFLTVAPTIAGYPEAKTYLFLLQNNTELRPTGGFIGTYGILKLNAGNIDEFKTDNIYNIDNQVKDTWNEIPPPALQRYLSASKWFLRDSNWDPDFPTSARKAEEFYHGELDDDQPVDGVIAVTPELIHDLLELTGPIEVDGDEYNADNLTEKLQYQVEIAFYSEGISDSGRKAVIGKLASKLLDRVMDLPQSSWDKLATVLITNLEEKHILIYSKDTTVQQLVREIGWDGSITNPEGDFVMVVDANLAAKKTDRVMTKVIDYSVTQDGEDYIANLTLHYKNDGVFDDFTTRYRSYLRVYVPEGSELLSSDGYLTNDRYLGGEPTTAETEQAAAVHKTVFAGFISVEPKTEDTIHLQYRLPPAVVEQINNGTYQLYWQKQPGTANVTATIDFDIGQTIAAAATLDETAEIDNTKVHFSDLLLRDLALTIELK